MRIFISSLVIALGITGSGWFIHQGLQKPREEVRAVTVRGFSERLLKADYAHWRIQVRYGGNDFKDLDQQVDSTRKKVTDFLIGKGFNVEELTYGPKRLNDRSMEWGGLKPEDNRYMVSDTILLKTKNIDALLKSLSGMTDWVAQGIHNLEGDPQFFVKNYDAFRNDMISEAIQMAQKSAVHVVQGTGLRVKGLKTVSQGPFSVMSDSANTENGQTDWQESTSSIKKIKVVTTCVFYLESED